MSLNDPKVETNLVLSRVIGDISTLSILSAKSPSSNPMFRLTRIFEPEIWIGIIFLYFIVTSLCHYLWSVNESITGIHRRVIREQTIFIDFISIVFRQNLKNFDRRESIAPIIMLWYLAAFIFSSAFSGALLSFLVFSKPFKTIDSIIDLAKSRIHVVMFEGENAFEYFKDPLEPLHDQFLGRTTAENPENGVQEEWEFDLFTDINNGEVALVSDQAYLDYHFATKLHKFPNLYRSQQNQLVMPYFLPLTYHIEQDQKSTIDKM